MCCQLRSGLVGAAARQIRVLRELSQWAFPDREELADEQHAPIDSAVLQRRRELAATETPSCTGLGPNAPSGPGPRFCFRSPLPLRSTA